ncbi:hypothetical protein SK128_018578 [Halocaridina rubra]|uniref:Uncharacterized protein n=1 Tax=Halocaridina rubra TaxID=373956 RepID=A0AAN8X222_HALRR
MVTSVYAKSKLSYILEREENTKETNKEIQIANNLTNICNSIRNSTFRRDGENQNMAA